MRENRPSIIAVATTLAISIAIFGLVQAARPAWAAPPQPPNDWSFYVLTTNTNTLWQLGCNQGNYDRWLGHGSEVVLDFGAQDSANSGTWLPKGHGWISYNTLYSLAENFAWGYYQCTGIDTWTISNIAIGTNNSGCCTDSGHGQAWAQIVKNLHNWATSTFYYYQVDFIGANDMETEWASQSSTINWINGYSTGGYSGGGAYRYVDYGDAGGCPPYGGCNGGWNQYGVWYKSYGAAPAWPLPEIYYPGNERQWLSIAQYNHNVQGWYTMYFDGPLDQYDLCGCGYTAGQAWTALSDALNSDPNTSQTMQWSAEIHNSN